MSTFSGIRSITNGFQCKGHSGEANLLWSWAERVWERVTNVSIFPTGNLHISIDVTLEFFIFCLIRHNISKSAKQIKSYPQTQISIVNVSRLKTESGKTGLIFLQHLILIWQHLFKRFIYPLGLKQFIYSWGQLIFILNYLLSSSV